MITMLSRNLKYSGVPSALILAQIAAILFYLNANIVNVGGGGLALPLLAAYVGFSILVIMIAWSQKVLFFRLHFLVFLVFLSWIALRVVIDLGDLEYLKQITIATTGGMLLFYLIGAIFNVAYVRLQDEFKKTTAHKFILLAFFALTVYLFINLLSRIRADIFLIADLDGAYQRPGNFLSISFMIASAILVSFILAQTKLGTKRIGLLFWVLLYSAIALLALISSQLMGSNSASAVVAGIFILTLITIMLLRNSKLRRLHAEGRLALPLSKYVSLGLVRSGFIAVFFLILLLTFLVQATDFDIKSIRLLGFGAGANTSLTSRFDLLIQTGADQMGYAPFLGNMNVAYLTTGSAGRSLHSFFPYIWANLGLVGLIISLTFFAMIFRQLSRSIKKYSVADGSLNNAIVMLYFMFILLFILVFANLAVGVSWAVMWFAVGFISQPFGFKARIKT